MVVANLDNMVGLAGKVDDDSESELAGKEVYVEGWVVVEHNGGAAVQLVVGTCDPEERVFDIVAIGSFIDLAKASNK